MNASENRFREQAKSKLSEESLPDPSDLTDEELREELRELRLRNIELELENDELRTSKKPSESDYGSHTSESIPAEEFELIFDNVQDALFLINVRWSDGEPEFVYGRLNKAHTNISGLAEDQIKGKTPDELFDPETADHLRERYRQCVKEEESISYREELEFPAGREIWQTLLTPNVRNGQVRQIVGAARPVTEETEQRRELRMKSEAMDQSPIGITITDPDQEDNPIIYVNDGFRRLTGYSKDEIFGQNCRFLQGEDTDPEQVRKMREAVDRREEVIVELKNYMKDGTEFWNQVTIAPITDEEGNLLRFVGFQQDVTKRKEIEHELEENAKFLERISDRVPGVLYQFKRNPDATYEFPYVSEGFEKIGGVPSSEAQDSFDRAMQYLHSKYREKLVETIERIAEEPSPWKQEIRFEHPDGTTKWALGSSVPEEQPDGSIVWTGVIMDITERKKAEQSLRESERRFRTLFEKSPIGLWEEDWSGAREHIDQLDMTGYKSPRLYFMDNPKQIQKVINHVVVLAINDTVLEITGAENREQLKSNLPDILVEESYEDLVEQVCTFLNGETSFSSTFEIRTFDGAQRSIHREMTMVPGHEEDWSRIFASYVDVTPQKQLQKRLEKSNRQMEMAQEMANLGHWQLDVQEETVHWSEVVARIMGVDSSRTTVDMEFAIDCYHEDDVGEVRKRVETAIEQEEGFGWEKRIRRPDGEVHYVKVESRPRFDENGKLTAIFGVVQDVTEKVKSKQELARSEKLYRSLFEEAGEAIEIISQDGEFLDVNESACELLGYEREELIGLPLNRVLAEEGHFEERLHENSDHVFRSTNVRQDGTSVPVEVNQTTIPWKEDRAILAFVRDLSELEWTRQRMEAIFNSTVSFIGLLNPDGLILEVNQAILEFLEKEEGELEDRSLHEVDWWPGNREDRPAIQEALQNAAAGEFARFEYPVVGTTGEQRFVDFSLTPVRGNQDDIIYIVLEGRDITEHKEASLALKKSREREEQFRKLAETIGVVFWQYDLREEEYQYVSSDCDQILGVSREKIYENPAQIFDYVHPEDRDRVESVLKGKKTEGYELKFRMIKNGETIWVKDRAFPVSGNEGNVTMAVGIVENVTEEERNKRKLQEQIKETERINKLKSDFVARTTHDLRTPLNAIIGLTDLLGNTNLNNKQRKHLESIRTTGRSMLHLTNDILDLDRIERDSLELLEEPFQIRTVVEEVVRLFRPRLRRTDIVLSYSIERDVPDRLIGDSNRLKQILVNLVDNAITHTESGNIEINLEQEELTDSEAKLIFAVSDTGKGISEEQQERIFRDRERGTASAGEAGHGLGLAICQNLVKLMGGEINLDSEEGSGSTFTFTACLDIADKDSITMAEEENIEGTNVLIADDSSVDRTIFRRYLSETGVEVAEAETAEEAENILTDPERYPELDAVFLDKHMKSDSGLRVLRNLHESENAIDPERIYIITGEPMESVRSKTEGLSFAGVLEKPFSRSTLVWAVQRVRQKFGSEQIQKKDLEKLKTRIRDRGLTAVIVDDNPEAQLILEEYMKDCMDDLSVVDDGVKAVRERFERTPDIMFMDLEMPGTDGLEAMREIRNREQQEGLDPVLIICQTALAMKFTRMECVEAGADGFIKKPFEQYELLKTVRDVLENREDE